MRAGLGFGADPRSTYEHWAERADPDLVFRNCGVNGERTDQIAARLATCTEDADALVVQGGVNDIAQGHAPAESEGNLRFMVERGKELGIPVAIAELLPWDNGFPAAAREINELNHVIHGIGRDEQVPVLPWYGVIEDPERPGRMRAKLNTDGAHPSVAGYRALGEITARRLPDS